MNITQFIKDEINLDDNACEFIKYKLKTRTQPFEYENELIFFTSLISCKIPFSIIRFADGEEPAKRGERRIQPFRNKRLRKANLRYVYRWQGRAYYPHI